jgi:hypothetical protein
LVEGEKEKCLERELSSSLIIYDVLYGKGGPQRELKINAIEDQRILDYPALITFGVIKVLLEEMSFSLRVRPLIFLNLVRGFRMGRFFITDSNYYCDKPCQFLDDVMEDVNISVVDFKEYMWMYSHAFDDVWEGAYEAREKNEEIHCCIPPLD